MYFKMFLPGLFFCFATSPVFAQVRTLPSEKAEAAIRSFKSLVIYSKSTTDICSGGARAWAKVFAAQTLYWDGYRATAAVGEACAQAGSLDAVGLELVIPKRIAKLRKPNDFKKRCMQAWTDIIAIEKAYMETGADKVVRKFRDSCYQPEAFDDEPGEATR